jgi:hypothetical protein
MIYKVCLTQAIIALVGLEPEHEYIVGVCRVAEKNKTVIRRF